WLTYEARARPDQPWTAALDDDEWQALAVARTNRAAPPAEPPRLCEAVRWIAQLGGFLARTGDGEPGVKTLWQGMQRLRDLTLMWRLTRSPPPFA
ncbi:MAG: IS4 family transposase, partial [Roseiflexaceae bacterium]|nr:IS4 family transposase [Roseiflexaceae bacterium]